MSVLRVEALCKRYPAFALENVSFTLEPGAITGFIGRNGAGKSTTIKAIMGLIHADQGRVRFFGGGEDERSVRQRIGYVAGGFDFYPRKKLRTITDVTRRFYPQWDEKTYRAFLSMFALDESKTPAQLSAGMKVKYALTLAMSHRAQLLILDEPTSGLDPVSREELLEIFLELQRRGVTILFSTHITSDLEKCADRILYIRSGKLAADAPLRDFREEYRLVRVENAAQAQDARLIGLREGKECATALVRREHADALETLPAGLETIMVHLEREERE